MKKAFRHHWGTQKTSTYGKGPCSWAWRCQFCWRMLPPSWGGVKLQHREKMGEKSVRLCEGNLCEGVTNYCWWGWSPRETEVCLKGRARENLYTACPLVLLEFGILQTNYLFTVTSNVKKSKFLPFCAPLPIGGKKTCMRHNSGKGWGRPWDWTPLRFLALKLVLPDPPATPWCSFRFPNLAQLHLEASALGPLPL